MKSLEEIANEVHEKLLKELSSKEQKLFFIGPYRGDIDLVLYHSTLGRYIRNHYKLWERQWTPIIENGVDVSPEHPDSISNEIIKMVWKKGPKRGN